MTPSSTAPAPTPAPEISASGVETEVIVVGAGPGGSSAARTIAETGASVLLLDRARFPRDKPCGGGVTIRCADLLPFSLDPVIEDVVDAARLRVRSGPDVERRSDRPLTYMTQRRHLDRFLAERAQEAGAEFRDGQVVTDVQRLHGGGFRVQTKDGEHRARVVIAADGANGIAGSRLGYERHQDGAVALEGNIRFPGGVPDHLRGRVYLNFGYLPGGYGWIFPKGDHVNVGVGGWRQMSGPLLRPALERICRLYDLDSSRLEELRGHHLPMRRPGATIAWEGSALVGDAAGLVDPLSGEGIYAALFSGAAVAPSVRDFLDGRVTGLHGYQSTLERELLPEVHTSTALMEIFHAWPAPFIWMMQRSDRFWRGACDLLLGDRDYVDLSGTFGPPGRAALAPVARAARALNERRYPRTTAGGGTR